MQTQFSYTSPRWRALADLARARDGARCSVSRLLGGDCSTHLHVHHLVPVSDDSARAYDLDNCLTVCSAHHPRLEALRRHVLHEQRPRRCRHRHPYPQGRVECERRLAMQG